MQVQNKAKAELQLVMCDGWFVPPSPLDRGGGSRAAIYWDTVTYEDIRKTVGTCIGIILKTIWTITRTSHEVTTATQDPR